MPLALSLPSAPRPAPAARKIPLFNGFIGSPPALPSRGVAAARGHTKEFHCPAIENCPRRQDIAPTWPTTSARPRFAPKPSSIHPAACTAPTCAMAHHGGSAPPSLKKRAGTPRMASPLFTIINSPSFTSHFYFFLGGRLSLPGPEGFPVVLGRFLPNFGPFVVPIAISPPQNQRPSPLHPRSGPRCSRRLPASRLPPAVGPAAPHCRTSPAKPAPTRCSNGR